MTLEAIKEAIERLPPEQQTVLASWLQGSRKRGGALSG